MLVISSREFRDNQKKYFEKADEGEQVIVQRGKNNAYALTPVTDDDWYFNPAMIKRLKESIQQAEEGNVIKVSGKEELQKFLDSLWYDLWYRV